MPYNALMSRKSSTCSLPAALLAENRMTPSSSIDGLSPTDSACSLDKAATLIISQTPGEQNDLYYPLNGSSSANTQPSVASYDMAILKAVTATHTAVGAVEDSTLSPPHSLTSPSPPHTHTLSPPTSTTGASDVQSDSSTVVGSDVSKATVGTLTRSSVGVVNTGGVATSWADRLDTADDEDRDASTPDWALLHQDRVRGRSHTPSHTPKHTPVGKRHSAEPHDGKSHHDNPITSARPNYHPPIHSASAQQLNWIQTRPQPQSVIHHHHLSGIGRSGGRHRTVGINGLAYTPSPPGGIPRATFIPGTSGLAGYPPVFTNHSRGIHQPPPPVCFNCGKKGHYGTSCPAETMDANNPDSKSTVRGTKRSVAGRRYRNAYRNA